MCPSLECPESSLSVAGQEEGQPGWAVPVPWALCAPPALSRCGIQRMLCPGICSCSQGNQGHSCCSACPGDFLAGLGRAVELGCSWSSSGVSRSAAGGPGSHENPVRSWVGRGLGRTPVLGNVTRPPAVTKPEFPWLAGVGSWVRLAKHPGVPSWVLWTPAAVPIVPQACCAPRVVAHPHPGCVVALGDAAATQSQPGALGQAEQMAPAKSFISDRNFLLLPARTAPGAVSRMRGVTT